MAEPVKRVRPTYSDAYLANPHKGCCTFQHFNGDKLFPGLSWSEVGPREFPDAARDVAEGYLPTTVAYCRWFWEMMEPEKGKYDFTVIEKALEVCANRGQTLAVRLMAHGSAKQPQVPAWYAEKYPMAMNDKKKIPFMAPVYDVPEYFEHWGGFVCEFAARYDAHPLIESIDVTYIGPWGEGAGDCSRDQCARFADLWRDAFVHTPRLALIGGVQMAEGVRTGAGWRCDCFGDARFFGSPHVPVHMSWNHMYDAYPRQLVMCEAADVWKTAPVHFETCGVPMHWYNFSQDLEFVIQQGLKYHGTYFMPKSTRLPDKWIDRLGEFCRHLGYRFALRQATLPGAVAKGQPLHFECWIENVGVAPIYRRYDFALRFRQGDFEHIVPFTDTDIRTWLPGDVWLDEQVPLPKDLRPGWVELSAGLIDPKSNQAKVNFAAKERYPDRWIPLDGFELRDTQ